VLEQQGAQRTLELFAGFGDTDEHPVDEADLVLDRRTGCGKIFALFSRDQE